MYFALKSIVNMKEYSFFAIAFVTIITVWLFTLTYVIGNSSTKVDNYCQKIDSLETVIKFQKTISDTTYVVIKLDNYNINTKTKNK